LILSLPFTILFRLNIDTIKPYGTEDAKKTEVAKMFDQVAHSYDFLNHFFSLGIDRLWRRRVVNILRPHHPKLILDIATGTADLALALNHLQPNKIIGVDISTKMLEIGKVKVLKQKLDEVISLELADSENLPFSDNKFDAITVSFGVRNFENLERGLSEMFRVLKPGGKCIVLEFSKPAHFPVKQLFGLYSRLILPTIGKLVSGDSRAYTYLPESVQAFPEGQNFLDIFARCGFTKVSAQRLSFGICSIYSGSK